MITVVGDLIVDEYYHAIPVGPHYEVPGGRKLRVMGTELRLGGAAAVAALIAGHEKAVLLGSVCADDALGCWAVEQLQVRGVQTEIHLDPERMTTVKTRIVLGHLMEPLRLDFEMLDSISQKHEDLLGFLHLGSEPGDALCIVDYGKGVLSGGLIKKLILRARACDIPILVDPAVGVPWMRYAGATLIKANRLEALEEASRLNIRDNLLETVTKLSYRHKCQIVVTDGKNGMAWSEGAKRGMVAACPAKLVDATGCGDVVLATLAVHNQLPVSEACQQAAEQARDCVGQLGVC